MNELTVSLGVMIKWCLGLAWFYVSAFLALEYQINLAFSLLSGRIITIHICFGGSIVNTTSHSKRLGGIFICIEVIRDLASTEQPQLPNSLSDKSRQRDYYIQSAVALLQLTRSRRSSNSLASLDLLQVTFLVTIVYQMTVLKTPCQCRRSSGFCFHRSTQASCLL